MYINSNTYTFTDTAAGYLIYNTVHEYDEPCSRIRERKVTPKGLKVNVPKGIMTRDQELRFKKKCEQELLRKTVKRLYSKQQYSDEKIAALKLDLRNIKELD